MAVSLSSTGLALANTSTTAVAQEDPTTTALNKITPALGKAHERVRTQLQGESTSLSQLGKFKATVADLSAAAKTLSQVGADTSVADGVQGAERFVAAYNLAMKASRPDESSAASSTLAASRRSLTNADTSRSQLAKLGISRQPDGTLKLDAAALKKALSSDAPTGMSTLAKLGQAIGKRADNELSSTSRLATSTNLYTDRATQLKQQQARLKEVASQLSAQATATGSTNGRNGTSDWNTRKALSQYTSGST